MNNNKNSIEIIQDKIKNLSAEKLTKLNHLLINIYSNYGTKNAPINETIRNEIKKTLKINNIEMETLEKYYLSKYLELKNKQ